MGNVAATARVRIARAVRRRYGIVRGRVGAFQSTPGAPTVRGNSDVPPVVPRFDIEPCAKRQDGRRGSREVHLPREPGVDVVLGVGPEQRTPIRRR